MDRIKEWNSLLKGMTYEGKVEFLTAAKNKTELEKIAEEFNIVFPSPTLAIFKTVYAITDEANANGCILPNEEVSKALQTLRHQPLDEEHLRANVIGHILKGELNDNLIIAYCIIYKDNFSEDYALAQKLLEAGNLTVSFEAYGEKVFKDDGTYELINIHFAGCGLLFASEPACDEAFVMEMATTKERVLEFASKINTKKDDSFIHINKVDETLSFLDKTKEQLKKAKYLEKATYNIWDCQVIEKLVNEAKKPKGEEDCWIVIESIDFVEQKVVIRYEPTNTKGTIDLNIKPKVKLTENAKYNEWDFETILRILCEVPIHKGEEECWREISVIDFDNNNVTITYKPSGTVVSVDLTPKSVVVKKGKSKKELEDERTNTASIKESFIEAFHKFDGNFDELEAFVQQKMDYNGTSLPEVAYLGIAERTKLSDLDFAVIKKIKCEKSGKRRKVRMFPLNDSTHVRIALARLEEDNVKDTFNQLGISYKKVIQKILNKAKELEMKDLLKKYEQSTVDEQAVIFSETVKELDGLKIQNQELMKAQETAKIEAETVASKKETEIAELKEALKEITTKAEEAKAELDRRDAEIKKAELATRKEALGNSAEGMEDNDILDDVKYELALLKKENSELKEAVAKTVNGASKVGLDKGSRDKGTVDPAIAAGKRVIERAYGKQA